MNTNQIPRVTNVMMDILRAIRLTNPDLIADNSPPNWGMSRMEKESNADDYLLRCIDAASEALISALDHSGQLDSSNIVKAAYELRLSVVRLLGEQERITAATESLRELLKSESETPETEQVLMCRVVVTGEPSHEDDQSICGIYQIEVKIPQAFNVTELTPEQTSEIATAVLDCFHEENGIKILDDFIINAYLPDSAELTEQPCTDADFSVTATHFGKVH